MTLYVLLLKTGEDAWNWDTDYLVYVFNTAQDLSTFLEKEIKRLYDVHMGFVTHETNCEKMMGQLVDVLEIQQTQTHLTKSTNQPTKDNHQ